MKNSESRIITNEDVADKTKLAYIRCSTLEQNEDRQLSLIQSLGIYKIYVEKASAKDINNRPMLKNLLEYARESDTIYCTDFSRLTRNVRDLLTITEDLDRRGIRLVSLTEGLDTKTSTGRLQLNLIASINQFLKENLLEKQREGIAIARQVGKFKGRKKVQRPDNWNDVYNQYAKRQITAKKAMELTCLKRNAFFNFANQAKSESEE